MEELPKQFYYKNNRLQQLRGFYFTAQFGSVSKAAKHMYLNQSTVSMQIKSLERDLDTILFERKGPVIELTADGKILYNLAKPLVDGIDGLCEVFYAERERKRSQTLNISASHVATTFILPPLVRQYTDKFPDTRISIQKTSIAESLRQLEKNKLHILLSPETELTQDFFYYPIHEYRPVLITPKGHPLTKIKKIKIEHIFQHPMFELDAHLAQHPSYAFIRQQLQSKSSVYLQDGNWSQVKALVANGIATAILLDLCISERDRDIDVIPLTFLPKLSYGFIIKRSKILLPQIVDFIKTACPKFEERLVKK